MTEIFEDWLKAVAEREWRVTAAGLVFIAPARPYEAHDLEPVDDQQVAVCLRWIEAYARHSTSMNKKLSTYALKNLVRDTPGYGYVTNGAFIQAAIELGYRVKPVAYGNFSAWLNMKSRRRLRRGARTWADAVEPKRQGEQR